LGRGERHTHGTRTILSQLSVAGSTHYARCAQIDRSNRPLAAAYLSLIISWRNSYRAGFLFLGTEYVNGETWLAKLKALEAHVALLQGTRAHVDTWRKVRKELEQIVPRPKGDLKSPPSVAQVLDQVETTSTADQTALWDEIRAEIEALRLKIRAEMEANRVKNARR